VQNLLLCRASPADMQFRVPVVPEPAPLNSYFLSFLLINQPHLRGDGKICLRNQMENKAIHGAGWRRTIFLFIACLLFPVSLLANDAEFDTKYVYVHSKYKVNADATHTEEHDWAMKVLDKRALERAKQASISYSTSIQKAKVLEAYTLKADGRCINVSKDNYQVNTRKGRGKDRPLYSDHTTLSVVFPEVQVGDTVVFSYELTQTEALFPHQFSASQWYATYYPYDDVRVTLDLPKNFPGKFRARHMKEKVSMQGDRKLISLSWSNKKPVKQQRRNYSVWNEESEPGFIYSTFDSYKAIAETYGARANPKAVVNERVRKLAKQIVKNETNKREQARLLYEWVATNISYAGNCIGLGAVVPHDVKFILENKMGDCKDHATLLQALLAAQSIRSTQALVNSGSSYNLLSVPTVASVNHVINYLPDYNLFVDSTSDETPFGMLPFSDADKPVLLVDGYREGLKTPVLPMGANEQYMESVVQVHEDGTASGKITVRQKGIFAVSARSQMRGMTKENEAEFMKAMFRGETGLGKGTINKDDPKPLRDTYHYEVSFDNKEFIHRPGAGAFTINSFYPTDAPVYQFIASATSEPEPVKVSCTNGLSVEKYTYVFPKGMKILAKPDDMKVANQYLEYSASYTVEGNKLIVERRALDKSPGNVCAPEIMREQREVGLKAIQNLRAQVVYQ